MNYDISRLIGKVFQPRDSGEQYGTIRSAENGDFEPAGLPKGRIAVATDDCGNAFLVGPDEQVSFWDHETDEIVPLAENWSDFCAACTEPDDVELDDSEVISVWIVPEFARKHGIEPKGQSEE